MIISRGIRSGPMLKCSSERGGVHAHDHLSAPGRDRLPSPGGGPHASRSTIAFIDGLLLDMVPFHALVGPPHVPVRL